MRLEILSASDAAQKVHWHEAWQELPSNRRDVYFRPEYFVANEAEGRGEARCLVARSNGALMLYPFLLVPVPHPLTMQLAEPVFDIQTPYGYGGPVVNSAGEQSGFLETVWNRFSMWCRQSRIVAEFCRFHPLLHNERWAGASMRVIPNRTTVFFDLDAYPRQFNESSFYKNHRQMVSKALRTGCRSETVLAHGHMDWFAGRYARTQDTLGAVSETRFSPSYFKSLTEQLGENAKLRLGWRGDTIALSVLLLECGTFSHAHLMAYGDEPPAFGVANEVLHGAALDAGQRGFKVLHLGGGRTADSADSLLAFKAKLSPCRASFSIGTRCHDQDLFDAMRTSWQIRYGATRPGFFLFYRCSITERPQIRNNL